MNEARTWAEKQLLEIHRILEEGLAAEDARKTRFPRHAHLRQAAIEAIGAVVAAALGVEDERR